MVDQLSRREREIIRRIAGPETATDLAADFEVSVPTMKWHLRNIYRKLGVSTRAEAVSEALVRQLVDPPAPFTPDADKGPGSASSAEGDRTIGAC